ncbi:YfiR family protein [Grimontia sp. NTOU-MAR1]|uniref:YfiR family protein n=1 Tax=Grimontia sp. NTOU-MAR1 TaxID=3111011 RepID=UPI002DBBFB36|nr:YfiR family protein [Grimontia sp. NTOU-MAR1]WRV99667.1 YfiR family protein [Grimontia sp. NTOU-MAR1]
MATSMISPLIHHFYRSDKARATLLWLSALIVFAISTGARASDIRDDDLKAVYLFRFAMLVDWKSSHDPSSQYQFCVDAENGVSRKLKEIIEKKPQAIFHQIQRGEVSVPACHIIYSNTDETDKVSALKATFPNALLVGEGRRFTRAGGMVAFVRVNNRIKPLINRKNLAGAPFSLRSQLLSIAVMEGRIRHDS